MIITQKVLDESWGFFINAVIPSHHSNDTKEMFIQLRNKLQKEINEKGYADTDDPKLAEWWLNNNKINNYRCEKKNG